MAKIRSGVFAMALASACLGAAGCTEDPQYLEPAEPLEGGLVDEMGEAVRAVAELTLPIKIESAEDEEERTALAAELGVDVPYVRLGDLEVSVEWSLQNQENRAGRVKISLNGANPYFIYDPSMIELGGGDEESPEAPALAGDIPLDVAPMGRISGVFREDQLRELSIDLDQITRANINPFRAVLQINEDIEQIQPLTPFDPDMPEVPQMPMGEPIPRAAIAQAIRLDISVESNTRVLLSYNVRVRDLRGLLHKRLMAAPVTGITPYTPVLYEP
jgi:hypothetical protein